MASAAGERKRLRCSALLAAVVCVAGAMNSYACSGHDRQIQQHQKALRSLGSTTHAIVEAWLAGNVSGTYAQTALDQTIVLIEQERTAVAASPEILIDPRGANLSDTADQMTRVAAIIIAAVRDGDAAAARHRLASLPLSAKQEVQ